MKGKPYRNHEKTNKHALIESLCLKFLFFIKFSESKNGGISVTTEKGTEGYRDLHHFVETMKKLGLIERSVDDSSYFYVDEIKRK